MRLRSVKYFYFAGILLIIGNLFGCIVFFEISDTTHFYLVNPLAYLKSHDTSCYRKRTQNTVNISRSDFFQRQSIFFLSTSCDKILESHGACAIESAARVHPEVQINLLYTSPVSQRTWNHILDFLLKKNNINLVGIHVESYADGTEFEKFWRSLVFTNKIANSKLTAEYLKFLTLHKFGGTVLDMDTIAYKTFYELGDNWVVKDEEGMLVTEALSISRGNLGRNITGKILRLLTQQIIEGGMNATLALTSVFKELCPEMDFKKKCSETCHDFDIGNDKLYQHMTSKDWLELFQMDSDDRKARAYQRPDPKKDSSLLPLYAEMAQRFCPWVYSGINNDY